jgi:DNA repair protein RecO (recombination protein O)
MQDGGPGAARERGRREFADLGIVLRTHKLGESDKILRILTREHGKRSAVAKGVRKTSSRFGARLEPLTCSRLLLHRGRGMDTVKQAEIQTSFQEVRADLDLFVNAAAMCELVDAIAEEHEPHSELFDLLLKGLELLKSHPQRARFTRAFFEMRVLAAGGFAPMLDSCANCGAPLGDGEQLFSLHRGGFVCEGCLVKRQAEVGKLVRVSAGTAGMLSWMSGHQLGEWPDEPPGAELGEAEMLMDRILEHWTERRFRSHQVMKEMP